MSVAEPRDESSCASARREPSSTRARAVRIIALTCALGLAIVTGLSLRQSWTAARDLMLTRGSGWLALLFLLTSLSVRPWARLQARLRGGAQGAWLVWRRLLGMTSAWLALLHAGIALRSELADFQAILSWPHIRAGAAALAILGALLLTSFPALVVRMRFRLWQELHRMVYAAALLTLQHLLLAPFAPRLFTLALFAATFLFGLLRWL